MTEKIYAAVNSIIPQPLYLVGGSVRDMLLNKAPKDYDFATPLSPDEVEALILKAGRHVYTTGKRFGTIGFKVEVEEKFYFVEVTTFRSEVYMPGSRKPEVSFEKDIILDLSRRDFTINAIAYREGNIVDPFGGQIDLKNKVIHCVGRAKTRFKEDPLRMLRAARFSSQLGFLVDEEIHGLIYKMAGSILTISKERWVVELDKLLEGFAVRDGLEFVMTSRLLNFMIPELSLQFRYDQDSPYHTLDLWEHTKKVVEGVEGLELRWAALLHDIGKPFVRTKNKRGYHNYIDHEKVSAEIVEKIAHYLRWSNDRRNNVRNLVLTHMKEDSPLKQADDLAK
jgi:putative nucleotidyltransferase with HDIG domain